MNQKLGTPQIRQYQPSPAEIASLKRNQIYLILDNILDTFNIGSIFRVADAIAAQKIYLVGQSATPDNPKVGHKIVKASVGTYQWIPWEHKNSVSDAVQECKAQSPKYQIIAIEQNEESLDYQKADYSLPLALIVGHETTGISNEGLRLADQVIEIPLFGVNKSLNVVVALSIVAYKILEQRKIIPAGKNY